MREGGGEKDIISFPTRVIKKEKKKGISDGSYEYRPSLHWYERKGKKKKEEAVTPPSDRRRSNVRTRKMGTSADHDLR